MKKTTFILAALLSAACISAQETLTLEQCREMALKYNKEMAAAARQTESARYTAKSYKGNFFPNFSLSGTGIYSTSDGSLGIAGGNLPTFLPDATGQFLPNKGFAYFPGIDLNYKIGMVYMGGIQVEQPLYMGGKIRAAYKMSLLGKEMAQLSETLTASEVIVKTEQAYAQVIKAKEMKKVADKYNAVLTELMKNVESAHKHGLKPQNDVLKVQVKLNESELNIRKADNALRLATMNLCHYIGKPLTADIRTADTFPEVAQDIRLQTADISARPEYAILNQQVAIAKQQVKLNRSELLPKIGVKGSYDYIHGLEISDQDLFDGGSFSVLLNVSVPLFHFGANSNKVRAAKAKLEQARLEQENMNEQMLLELAQSVNNLDEARLEAEKQMEMAGEYPDMIIGCFGGGSNFGGICFPFMRHTILEGKKTRYIAAEPASCPKLTRGKFEYDFGDEAGYTPLLPMFTLGHNFTPANIHAGGLRYHGAGVIVSQLLKDNLMEAVDIQQLDTFKAGCLFARAEGIIPAPESCHAIAAAIQEAEKCKETGEEKVILFNLSGHGLIDMSAYDQYLSGNLTNYSLSEEDIANSLQDVPQV